jgi:hypothetical protein
MLWLDKSEKRRNYSLDLSLQVDVSEVVKGHSVYLEKTSEILAALDIDNFYPLYPAKVHAAAPSTLEPPSKPNQASESNGHPAPLLLESPSAAKRASEASNQPPLIDFDTPSEPH